MKAGSARPGGRRVERGSLRSLPIPVFFLVWFYTQGRDNLTTFLL